MASQAFERFAWSCFDNSFHAYRDGLDTPALLSLDGEERLQAESLILDAIRTTQDTRPFEAAGWLRLPEAAELLGQRLSAIDSPWVIATAAWALNRIEESSETIDTIMRVLRSNPLNSSLWWHATVLLRFVQPSPQAIAFLVRVLTDETLPGELAASSMVVPKSLQSRDEDTWGEVPDLPRSFTAPTSLVATEADEQRLLQARVLADCFDSFVMKLALETLEHYLVLVEGRRAVQAIDPHELDGLTKSVMHSLQVHQDVRAAAVAGLLEIKDAVADLKAILASSEGLQKVAIALALYRIEASTLAVDAILSVLQSDAHQYDRWQAITALRKIELSAKVIAALIAVVEADDDGTISKLALHALADLCRENPLPVDLVERIESQIQDEAVQLENGRYRIDVVKRPSAELMNELRQAIHSRRTSLSKAMQT